MKKQLLFALYFLITFSVLAQEKIPFINFDEVVKKVSEATQSNDYDKAIESLNKINKNDSTYCSILVTKSYYLLNSKKYKETIETVNEGLNLSCYNINASLYINKGSAYTYLEEYDKALEIYIEAIKKYPNHYLLWYNKAVVLEKINKTEEAIEAFKKAITLNPTYAKPHLQLGNICYKQGLISQALLCYNMYLLLTFDEENAFNTLKAINNIIVEKNENEANPNLQISKDDQAFEDIDLILSNKIALNKNYKTGNEINISLTKQNHALLAQLKDFEGNGGFWDKKYVPLFNWITNSDQFNGFIYTICYPIKNEEYSKIVKQNEKKIITFMSQFYDKWRDVLKTNTILFDGKKQEVEYNYYDDYIDAIGKMENNISIGNWQFFNENGQLLSYGSYNEKGNRTGKWTWLYKNGFIKETAIYKNNLLNGENLQFHENEKPSIISSYKDGELDGEYKYYNDKGALLHKKYFKNGKLDGLYESFFKVGEELIEFNIPYKDGAVQNLLTEYYADGNIYSEIQFAAGKRNGFEKKYFHNKKIASEINYQNGELNGSYKSYFINGNTNKTGQSIDNFFNGPWKTYYKDGTLNLDFKYNNGNIDGVYKNYDTDGKIYYEYLYRKGEILEYKYYNKEGEILSEGRKKKGEFKFKSHYPNANVRSKGLYDIKGGKEGLWEFYSSNGVLISKGNYANDKANGEHLSYHNNGEIESKSIYKNDSLQGYFTNYHINGQLKQQGWYKDNLALGEWRTYYIDGTIEAIHFYHKDELHGIQENYSEDGKLSNAVNYKYGEFTSEVYYDNSGKIIETLNYKPKINNFIITQHYANKNPKTKVEYVNGVRHGTYVGYDFYGNIILEGNYINDYQNGKWTRYYENGKIESIRNYLNGNLNGKSIDNYENGNLESELFYEYGKAITQSINYHENGKKATITDYDEDVVHGKKVFYGENENIQLIRFYNQGTLIGYSYLDKDSKELPMIPIKNETGIIKSYYNNGKIARELEYKNGDLINTYNEYHYSGQLESSDSFKAGKYDGNSTEYYANGKTKNSKNYLYSILQGIVKNYHENGEIKEEINYNNGIRSGKANFYNENGKLIKTEYYFNGDVYDFKTY